jgi:hypothetical protein
MPRNYADRRTWSQRDRDRLWELVMAYAFEKRRVNWDLIVADVGHPVSSCRSVMSLMRSDRRFREDKERRAAIKAEVALMVELEDGPRPDRPKLAPKPIPTRAPVDVVDTMRCTSTAQLMLHAEIRARTGNWFGDPAPGRSALDKKRAGVSP